MDELYELLIHEVHRYEGTVNELTGDGLVAFFGAPLAVEQAPQRAVRAALALQEAVAQFSTSVERERGVRLQLRVGHQHRAGDCGHGGQQPAHGLQSRRAYGQPGGAHGTDRSAGDHPAHRTHL